MRCRELRANTLLKEEINPIFLRVDDCLRCTNASRIRQPFPYRGKVSRIRQAESDVAVRATRRATHSRNIENSSRRGARGKTALFVPTMCESDLK